MTSKINILAQPKLHVSLVIIDDNNGKVSEEVTSETGLIPSVTWRKGDRRGKSGICHKDNGWELKSNLPLEAHLADHISAILLAVKPAHDKFLALTTKHYSQISCAIYFNEETPELHLDAALLKQIADLNLTLDLDLYPLG